MVLALGACKSKSQPAEPAASTKALAQTLALVKVDAASALTAEDPIALPLVVILDDSGAPHVAAASSWKAIAAIDIAKTRSAALDSIDRHAREGRLLGKTPEETLKSWSKDETDAVGSAARMQEDDPPPPEQEDKPDDEESAGTGTAMALDEGKMGKKDRHAERGPLLSALSSPRKPELDDGSPWRLATVGGEIIEDGRLTPARAVIVPLARTPATKVIEAIGYLNGPIAVAHAGGVRLLRIDFMPSRDATGFGPNGEASWGTIGTGELPRWFEARVSAKGLVIEAVPDVPLEVSSLDPKLISETLGKARAQRGIADDTAPVDVLVDADVGAQRLVDVLVAFDAAGVRAIGLGNAATAEDMKRRGKRMPMVRIGQPNAQGDLDKAMIRKVVKDSLDAIQHCYDVALQKTPTLAGTVMVQFFISPDGKVKASSASGVDPTLAKCVADAVKTFVFPKPRGGGGVQVNYPFTFRP